MTLSMFREADQERAQRLLSAYNYEHQNAIEQTLLGEFKKSAIHHGNAAGFQEQLQELKNKKQLSNQIELTLKQIEGDRQMTELINGLIRSFKP